ncbi:uncharacterized protein [Diadema setosum]|uniref:uncharacterized protein n=1 Tax=Diadema setosum TaxID=31175 RepID=UPI003B3A39C6
MAKNITLMKTCLTVALLLVDQHSGQGRPSQRTPASVSCDAKCNYLESTREANCDYRQLSEVPMECNAAIYLSLSQNQIERIEPGTFEGFSNLEVLILSNNNITQLEANIFTGAPKLKVINLQGNKLSILHIDIFAHLSRLQTLILSDNQLISTGTILLLPEITTLDVRNNRLASLEKLTEETLGRLEVFLLEGNPWNCDCQLETLRLWYSRLQLPEDHRVDVDSPICYEPPSLTRQPINGGLEGFCPNLIFSSTTDSTKSTYGLFDEMNNFTSPDTSPSNSRGKSNLKIIVPATSVILTMMLVCVMICVWKHKCRSSERHLRSKTKTAVGRKSTGQESTSFPQSEQRIASENTLKGNSSVNEERVVKYDMRESDPITTETTPMINFSVQGAQDEAPTHEREQRTNDTTPTKTNRFEGNTAVKGGKTPSVSFCYTPEEIENARKQLPF